MSEVNPLVSIVIPTFGRPQLLERAIRSALESVSGGDLEVIVVPNGGDQSWREVDPNVYLDERVKVLPIDVAHANSARNHGLRFARGKYVRFLDDDDMLFSEGAKRQIDLIEDQQGEICSGRVQHVGPDGRHLGRVSYAITSDFVCAALSVSGYRLPTSNVFLRSALKSVSWNERVPRAQDHVWMLDLASIKEWRWLDFSEDVGGWFHHAGERTSSASTFQPIPVWQFDAILALHLKLQQDGRLNDCRRQALASAIWSLSHNFFPRFPMQCHKYAKQALRIDERVGPAWSEKLQSTLGIRMPSLLVEWLMLPKRYGNHLVRAARQYIFGKEVIRKL